MSSMFCCTFYIIEWGKVTNISQKKEKLANQINVSLQVSLVHLDSLNNKATIRINRELLNRFSI